nr:unnamed protein product [Callosobruchus analis]
MASNIQNIDYVQSTFNIHTFYDEIMERKVIFQVLKMGDSFLIYINDKEQNYFGDLCLAMINCYEDTPVSTKLIGNSPEDFTKHISSRLTRKLGKSVFLSCNLEPDRMFVPLVEKRLHDEIKNNPSAFL